VGFAAGALQALELFKRDAQLFGLMTFEGSVEALLEQFAERGTGRAIGLLGFSLPKHKSLLRHDKRETQVWLEVFFLMWAAASSNR
jgi:hypothetical protein